MEHYDNKRILAVYNGLDAWKKHVPIRWPQPIVAAQVRRRFKNYDMTNSKLVISLTPKTGEPQTITAHFYPHGEHVTADVDTETDDLWITSAPYSLLKADDAPTLLKRLVADLF